MKFKVLAVNDDSDCCECCGKTGLKRVVWIENTETGEIRHFGVVCATKPEKGFECEKEINTAISVFEQAERFAHKKAWQLYKQAAGSVVTMAGGYGVEAADKALYKSCLEQAKFRALRHQTTI
jgi:hypothetical protein